MVIFSAQRFRRDYRYTEDLIAEYGSVGWWGRMRNELVFFFTHGQLWNRSLALCVTITTGPRASTTVTHVAFLNSAPEMRPLWTQTPSPSTSGPQTPPPLSVWRLRSACHLCKCAGQIGLAGAHRIWNAKIIVKVGFRDHVLFWKYVGSSDLEQTMENPWFKLILVL
jgi:hypothetical protein